MDAAFRNDKQKRNEIGQRLWCLEMEKWETIKSPYQPYYQILWDMYIILQLSIGKEHVFIGHRRILKLLWVLPEREVLTRCLSDTYSPIWWQALSKPIVTYIFLNVEERISVKFK